MDPRNQRPAHRHPRFSCRRATIDGAVHIALGGELDIATVSQLDAVLRLAWASADTIVLDLRELEFIDFSGAHLITDADRRIRRAGGRLTAIRGCAELDWLFTLYGVDRLLEFVASPRAGGAFISAEHAEVAEASRP